MRRLHAATQPMTTLPRFITCLAIVAALAPWAPAASQTLRVGIVVDSTRREALAGLKFGFAEAQRSARLFGWRVSVIPLSAEMLTHPRAGPYDALIVAARVAHVPDVVPVFALECDSIAAVVVFRFQTCSARDPTSNVVAWHASLQRFGGEQLNDRYRSATGSPMTSGAWTAWFAAKVITESALRARSSEPAKLLAYLRSPAAQFDGHKGVPLTFDSKGQLQQPLYVVQRTQSGRERVLREIPPRAP